ncbi:MAG TPA: ribonuclease HII [Chloroflexota bacterium]|nr:ribonuclease HII [Chloroflexota bacterium]
MDRGARQPRSNNGKPAKNGRSRSSHHPRPTRRYELRLYRDGLTLVAGIDEVGRGCLAGPVLAAAVVLPLEAWRLRKISGVADSKVLTAEERERLYERIIRIGTWGVGLASHRMIDRYGIAPASRVAMAKACGRLGFSPQHLLIDAVRLPMLDVPQTPIIDGDALCLSIAAASIVAKVTRDRLMSRAAEKYPGYGFESHKGYGTQQHHDALIELGPCPIHRLTFKPAFASCSIGDMVRHH